MCWRAAPLAEDGMATLQPEDRLDSLVFYSPVFGSPMMRSTLPHGYSKWQRFEPGTLATLLLLGLVAVVGCSVIDSVGFYFLDVHVVHFSENR